MIELIEVDGGSFLMGSDTSEQNESPAHQVNVSSFSIGKYAVTQYEWLEIIGKVNAYNRGNQLPVEQVTWLECIAFCNKLSLLEHLECCYMKEGTTIRFDPCMNGYRLPSEAEWEFAAKGGIRSLGYTFSGSNSARDVAWYKDNSDKHTHEVGKLMPNELGLYDMSGNVYEHCWDVFKDYKNEICTNPFQKLASNESERHLLKGGNCHGFDNRCRPESGPVTYFV